MRIPLTERFKWKYMLAFASVLLIVQLAEGTNSSFALLTFAYICIFTAAYNVAGGIFFPSGGWIFFTGVGTTLLGLVFKALLGERAESNLAAPNKTLMVYCAGLAGMGVAAWLSRLLRPKAGLLSGLSVGDKMKGSAIGCLVIGILLGLLPAGASRQDATLSSAVAQLNHFSDLAILLGTTYQIQKSGGRSSTNWIVWVGGLLAMAQGVIYFSKNGMFTPVTIWVMAAILLGFRFSKAQVLIAAVFMSFMFYYMVPYSQVGRKDADPEGSWSKNYDSAQKYLLDLNATREAYLTSTDVVNVTDKPHLYQESHGIFDRLEMLAMDDALIARTDTAGPYGLAPMQQAFYNLVPHFLWKNKPNFLIGNDYGREIGVIGDYDESTGISFSSTADAYHEAEWPGVLIMEPVLMFLMFLVSDTLSGDVRKSPWGLLYLAMFAHAAPEGVLPVTLGITTTGALAVVVAAMVSGLLLPYLARLMSIRQVAPRPAAGRVLAVPSGGVNQSAGG